MELSDFFLKNPRAALAFSGGTDSGYLLYAAGRYGARVRAYYVKTPFQPAFELEDARRLADELHAELSVIEQDVLNDGQIVSNPPDRCYYCKKAIFSNIISRAASDGFTTVIDGTNASDDAEDRPGMRALAEIGVVSPLRLCGITKDEVRARSKEAGLFTWDKPAYACLATRIPSGTRIEYDDLRRVEAAEKELAAFGFSDFRVRFFHGAARLQFPGAQFASAAEKRAAIAAALKKYFPVVLIDTETR
ncbi:MAG: ATP-dependent sacrificial sulfur transferase LarE [Synergistes sp.]|nr:ATP-dependent sacrificial sulfur transferase LarE [Synergistes sp.]